MDGIEFVRVTCPNCGKRLRVKAALIGKQARCPNPQCGVPIRIAPDSSASGELHHTPQPTLGPAEQREQARPSHGPLRSVDALPSFQKPIPQAMPAEGAKQAPQGTPRVGAKPAKRYGGIRRRQYILGLLGMWLMVSLVVFLAFITRDPGMIGLIQAIGFIASVGCLLLVIQRLQNIGVSGWWSLLTLVPGPNLLVGVACLACPEGFRHTKKLDAAGILVGIVGLVVGVVSAAVLFVFLQGAAEVGRRKQSRDNLKRIGLAMHDFVDAHDTFPSACSTDKEGKPLLSWRVHLLPHLGEAGLYQQFRLGESWESEHNRTLIPMMPSVFRNPSSLAEPGMANYLGASGQGLMFDGTKTRRFADITDGTSTTILIVEANDDRAVPWTKPADWDFDEGSPLAGLGKAHPGGFLILFADGSVRFIPESIDPKLLHALLTTGRRDQVRGLDGLVVPGD